MRAYEVLTGERVRIYAENEDEMWEKLSNGEYEQIETDSTIEFVGAEIVSAAE